MLGHHAEEDEENPDTMPKKILKSRHDAEEPEIKRIESRHDAGEPETKGRDRIRARCRRTRNKRKGSNMGAMPENSKQKEGIESGSNARELETK